MRFQNGIELVMLLAAVLTAPAAPAAPAAPPAMVAALRARVPAVENANFLIVMIQLRFLWSRAVSCSAAVRSSVVADHLGSARNVIAESNAVSSTNLGWMPESVLFARAPATYAESMPSFLRKEATCPVALTL